MSAMDLSLGDLIFRQRKMREANTGGGGMLSVRPSSTPRQCGCGFAPLYESMDWASPLCTSPWIGPSNVGLYNKKRWLVEPYIRTKIIPPGKWCHDKYYEIYGDYGWDRSHEVSGGGRTFGRFALNNNVSIHVTNLASTVTSDDLDELLEEYPLISALVNHDEFGQPAGTADIVLGRAAAEEVVTNFTGVAIDGRTMHMHVLDENKREEIAPISIKKRLSFKVASPRSRGINKRAYRTPFKAIRGRHGNARGWRAFKGGRGNGQGDRRKMTLAELDKELQEYMKKRSSTSMES